MSYAHFQMIAQWQRQSPNILKDPKMLVTERHRDGHLLHVQLQKKCEER